MAEWRQYISRLMQNLAALPKIFWVAGGVIVASLGVAMWVELSGPPYAVLEEGLSPQDGGKVIAQLQKLGIPYQLQAAGNIILVPAPQLAQARLQLGQAQVPGSDVQTAWSQLETAPMTASDLAQSTMAQQALQLSLQQSIQRMNGIRSAQVFLALPQQTPFLADQPKPAASVVIEADAAAAQVQGQAIANLIAGAVPGLAANDVTVETTDGVTVFPASSAQDSGTQLQTVAQVETMAEARVAALLIPMVGAGHFRTDVSANLDFTQEHIREITYGPGHVISHQTMAQSMNMDGGDQAIGIPGALSNEPPQATAAVPASASQNSQNGKGAKAASGKSNSPAQPRQSSSNTDQTYEVDESDADIIDPAWSVKSMAISVVLDKAALKNPVTVAQVQSAVASAFAYPDVKVNILAVPFQKQVGQGKAASFVAAVPPVAQALLEMMAAAALLFGFAIPAGKRLAALNVQAFLPPVPRPVPLVLPPRDFSDLRDKAAENIPGVARLLQNWAEDNE